MTLLDEVVAETSIYLEAQDPPYPALWRLQRQQMRDDLAAYLSAQIDEAPKLNTQCLHFELGFGLGGTVTNGMDPTSRADPVSIETPIGPVRLRGKIDRIDRVRLEDLDGLLVTDYKTGRLPGKGDIDAGRSLQAALYAPAAEKLLNRPSLGGAYHQIGLDGKQTYLAAIKRRGGHFRPDEQFDSRHRNVMAKVGQFVQRICAGGFDVLPTHDCPSFCPFRRICHYVEHRAALKTALPQEGQA
jgi:ATP-dependent helicase/DNAse subunit B